MTPPPPTSILGSSQHVRTNRHTHLLCSGCESLRVAGLRGWLRKPGRCWTAKDHPATYTGWRPAPLPAGPHPWAHLHIGHTPVSLWRFPFPNTQTTTSNSCSICVIYDFSNHTFVSLEFYRHSQGLLLQDSLQWEVAMLVFRLPGVEIMLFAEMPLPHYCAQVMARGVSLCCILCKTQCPTYTGCSLLKEWDLPTMTLKSWSFTHNVSEESKSDSEVSMPRSNISSLWLKNGQHRFTFGVYFNGIVQVFRLWTWLISKDFWMYQPKAMVYL